MIQKIREMIKYMQSLNKKNMGILKGDKYIPMLMEALKRISSHKEHYKYYVKILNELMRLFPNIKPSVINNDYIVSNLTKIIKNTRSYTFKYSMNNQRIVYLYPKSFGDLTSIKDENNFENLNSFIKSYITVNGVNYIEYKLINTASNSNGTLTFN